LSKRQKLVEATLNNPSDVRFEDACKIAELIGFTCNSGEGSHFCFAKPGETDQLNFQNRNGKIKPYQGRQLAKMIERYWDPGSGRQKSDEQP